jgi:hypothetical protein
MLENNKDSHKEITQKVREANDIIQEVVNDKIYK